MYRRLVGTKVALQEQGLYIFFYENHSEDAGVDGKIILRLIFRNWNVGVWTGSMLLRLGIGGRHL
jgi:hypothetical protein